MKHTIQIVDKILILLTQVPPTITSHQDREQAARVISQLCEYALTLQSLIKHHRLEEFQKRLHESHVHEIEDWIDKIVALFSKLDALLTIIREDVFGLLEILNNHPEKWSDVIADLAMGMVMTGLHDQEGQITAFALEMERFKKIHVFTSDELRNVVPNLKHVDELLE